MLKTVFTLVPATWSPLTLLALEKWRKLLGSDLSMPLPADSKVRDLHLWSPRTYLWLSNSEALEIVGFWLSEGLEAGGVGIRDQGAGSPAGPYVNTAS